MIRFCIAGLELAIETDRPDLVHELAADWVGYASSGRSPEVVLAFEAVEGHLIDQPAGRAYPGYSTLERSPSRVVLERRDGRLTVDLPDDGPVRGHLRGRAATWALETALRALYSFALPRRGGLLLHSAGLRWPDRNLATICCGPSGAGKSTLSRLLQEASPCVRLGDDMTAVSPGPSGYVGHATPFAGELGPAPDGAAPLGGLYFLVKGTRHHLTRLSRADAIGRLLRNTVGFVDEPSTADRALAAAAALAGAVPMAILEFARDPSIAEFLAQSARLDLS